MNELDITINLLRFLALTSVFYMIVKRFIFIKFYKLSKNENYDKDEKYIKNFIQLNEKTNLYTIGYWLSLILGLLGSLHSNNNLIVLFGFLGFIIFLILSVHSKQKTLEFLLKQ